MSAWYIFSAMGFYPVNPVSGEYVVGSYKTFHLFFALDNTSLIHSLHFFFRRPLFEGISINLNSHHHHPSSTSPKKLPSIAIGARSKPYIKSLTINGISIARPIIKYEQIANGAEVIFEMSDEIEMWGNDDSVLKAFGVGVGVGGSGGSLYKDEEYFHNEL